MSKSNPDFFDAIHALVPWMTRREASDALNEFESQLFIQNPDWLQYPEEVQNAMVVHRFKQSKWVRRG